MGRGELATHLGVSSQMIRAIEGGRRRPSWALFGRIVDVLGWDVVKRADLEAELRLPDVEAAP
jgi:DNA-binding XRE family transcriptional regulator